MNIEIVSQAKSQYGHYFTVNAEGQEIKVNAYADGRVNVCVINAMSHAFNNGFGHGKMFDNFEEALNGYKGAKPKAAITVVMEELARINDQIN